MFTVQQREAVRQYVLHMAQSDPRVTGGAIIGSMAAGAQDEWSDIDLTFGISDDITVETVLDDWTQTIEHTYGLLHHWGLRSGPSLYRVFLLVDGLEIDLSATPAADFGARGPRFQLLFGNARPAQMIAEPDADHLIGLCWHHVLHARSCIERHKPWQAAYWISELRNYTLMLVCLRLGTSTTYARGVDTLPSTVTAAFVETLVCSLDETELRRALAAATECLVAKIEEWDIALGIRLQPLLAEWAGLSA